MVPYPRVVLATWLRVRHSRVTPIADVPHTCTSEVEAGTVCFRAAVVVPPAADVRRGVLAFPLLLGGLVRLAPLPVAVVVAAGFGLRPSPHKGVPVALQLTEADEGGPIPPPVSILRYDKIGILAKGSGWVFVMTKFVLHEVLVIEKILQSKVGIIPVAHKLCGCSEGAQGQDEFVHTLHLLDAVRVRGLP